MKKTLNVNIGQTAFVIDEDAYAALNVYLDDIRQRCDASTRIEIMSDVELRIADLFSQWLSTPNSVVTIEMVRRAQGIIGRADEFSERSDTAEESGTSGRRRLTRSRNERVIGGVCGGLAEYFGIDPTLLRVITFLLIFFGGVSLWIYIILWIIIPQGD